MQKSVPHGAPRGPVHAFVQDFTNLNDMCAKDIRDIIKHYNDNAQYVYCDAYRNVWGEWSKF